MKSTCEKYRKGLPRTFQEAKALNLIDPCIAGLTDIMNSVPLISTTGSCQGHGLLFIAVPPYISFKSSIEVAAAFAKAIHDDFHKSRRKLNYHWELTASFDHNSELTYMLTTPGIVSRKWFYATRTGLDRDFASLGAMIQKILNHCDGKKVVMKSKPKQTHANKSDAKQNHL